MAVLTASRSWMWACAEINTSQVISKPKDNKRYHTATLTLQMPPKIGVRKGSCKCDYGKEHEKNGKYTLHDADDKRKSPPNLPPAKSDEHGSGSLAQGTNRTRIPASRQVVRDDCPETVYQN